MEPIISGAAQINVNSSCGADGVHPSALKCFNKKDEGDMDRLRSIWSDALTKDDLFSSRMTLIPKKDSAKRRPIQVLNLSLRCLEKGFLSVVDSIPLQNPEVFHSFVRKRSTHTHSF